MLVRQQDSIRGILWMVAAAVCFSATAGMVRHLSETFSTPEITFLRQILGAVTVLPALLMQGGLGAFRTTQPWTHFLRGGASYLGMLASFYSLTLITLADSMALQFTLPFFTFFIAMWMLGERIGIHRWLATAIGFAGVLVIVRPGFGALNIGMLVALAAAAVYALSDVTTRLLSRKDSISLVMFYTFILPVPFAAILAALAWTWPGWDDVAAILIFSAFSTTASYCLTRAFAVAEVSVVSPVLYLRLPFVAVIGYAFFAQSTDIWTWIGAAIIFASTYSLARREAQLHRRSAARTA